MRRGFRFSQLSAVALLMGGGLVLGGCATEVDDGATANLGELQTHSTVSAADPEPAADNATVVPPEPDMEPEAEPETEPEPAPEPEPAATTRSDADHDQEPGEGTASCLVGDWLADNEFFLAGMRQFGDVVDDVTGEVHVTFDDGGGLTTDYRDWRITALKDGHKLAIHRDGTDVGTYAVEGATIDIRETQMGSSIRMSGGGIEMPIAPEPATHPAASFTCDQASATISTTDGVLRLSRLNQ